MMTVGQHYIGDVTGSCGNEVPKVDAKMQRNVKNLGDIPLKLWGEGMVV